MKLLSSEEYQDRINPWLNKNLHIVHSIPVSFPRFQSSIANEAFLFMLTIVFFAVMYVGISLLFSLPGISSSTSVVDNLEVTFKNSKGLIFFSLFVLIYLRATYFILSKLNNESLVAAFGFLIIMTIPFVADCMPMFENFLDGKPINYTNRLNSELFIWLPAAYIATRKLLRQFQEAQNKIAAKAK